MPDTVTRKSRRARRDKPFAKGQSGNSKGRPAGSRNKASLMVEALLDGEAGRLTHRAIELADGGDPTALKLVFERLLAPRRERAVQFHLPPIKPGADIAPAMGTITAAVADGILTPGEAEALAQVVDTFVRAIDASDFEQRLQALETHVSRS
jgi:hypothetical protein